MHMCTCPCAQLDDLLARKFAANCVLQVSEEISERKVKSAHLDRMRLETHVCAPRASPGLSLITKERVPTK